MGQYSQGYDTADGCSDLKSQADSHAIKETMNRQTAGSKKPEPEAEKK